MTRVTYSCHIHFSNATLKIFKQGKSLTVGGLTNIFCSFTILVEVEIPTCRLVIQFKKNSMPYQVYQLKSHLT